MSRCAKHEHSMFFVGAFGGQTAAAVGTVRCATCVPGKRSRRVGPTRAAVDGKSDTGTSKTAECLVGFRVATCNIATVALHDQGGSTRPTPGVVLGLD